MNLDTICFFRIGSKVLKYHQDSAGSHTNGQKQGLCFFVERELPALMFYVGINKTRLTVTWFLAQTPLKIFNIFKCKNNRYAFLLNSGVKSY